MALVTMAEILARAEAGEYAVGAFNCNNMEIIQAIINAAVEEKSPVIVQASQGAIKYAGIDYIVALTKLAAEKADVPVALHLDHGTSYEQCVQCIDAGFTSVMIDASKNNLAENIALTNKVIAAARKANVSVEGELGKIGGVEDDIFVNAKDAVYTDPGEAEEFVRETGVDALAIAIGTAHGQYKGEPELDLERLFEIKKRVDIPIVLHGSSGVPDEAIRAAVARGVRKVNIDTNIREAFMAAVKKALTLNPNEIDPRKALGPGREQMTILIREKIRLFGSNGKA